MSIALTLALVATPHRALQQLVQLERAGVVLPRPLLHAAAIAVLPVSAVAIWAALLPARTVGSVVIATLGAVLAYLGGVVAGDLAGDLAEKKLRSLTACPQARRLAAVMTLPTLAVGIVAAFLPGPVALAAAVLGGLWSHRVGVIGTRDLLALHEPTRLRVATACALAVNGPVLLRGVLYAL